MGARIDTQEGRPPVRIHGGAALHGIDYVLPIASAQVKSALLLAGLYAHGMTRVTEPAPTRDHTERMLRGFGVQVERRWRTRRASRGGQRLRGCAIEVPGDFSSAAFFIVAGCLGGARRADAAQRRLQSDAHRAAGDAAADGRAISRCSPRGRRRARADGGHPRARQRRCAASACPRRWCRWRSMSFRCSSSPRRLPRARRW